MTISEAQGHLWNSLRQEIGMLDHLVRCPKGNIHQAQLLSPHYVFLDGLDWRWLAVSKEFAKLLGHNPSYLVGKTTRQMMPKGMYDPKAFELLLQNEQLEIEYIFHQRDGDKASLLMSLRVLEDGCILGIARPT